MSYQCGAQTSCGHPVHVIYLGFPQIECVLCGATDASCWGIPVSDDGYIVPAKVDIEWAGQPVCEKCHERYQVGLLDWFDMWGMKRKFSQ